MAFSRAQLALAVLCLALLAPNANCWSLRRLLSLTSFGGPCLDPGSQDLKPPSPGPADFANGSYYCFGFQFTSTHEPTPVTTELALWYATIGNALVNPFVTLGAVIEEPVFEVTEQNSPLYYPLDGALGSGAAGTGYGGLPYKKSAITGKYVYSVAFQIENLSDNENLTYAKLNKALRNLGYRLKRFFPTRGAVRRRPGVIDFEVTTYFVRQDPRVNGLQNRFNVTVDGAPTPTQLVKGCRYI